MVVFTGKELSSEEEAQLKTVAKSVVLKDVQSPERLFDETALFGPPRPPGPVAGKACATLPPGDGWKSRL